MTKNIKSATIFLMNTFTIETQKMTFGGECIAKLDGKNIFIPFALPNETLEVAITEDKGDYAKAKIVSILKPSPYRREAPCSLYGLCGGCNMMHITDEEQVNIRKQVLKDAFEREGIKIPEIVALSASPFAYRSRFQLHDGGLKQKESNNIIPISTCPIATNEINTYLTSNAQKAKGRVHIFGDSRVTSPSSHFLEAKEISRAKAETRIMGKPNKKIKRKENVHFSGSIINPENICTVNIAGKQITFDVQGFFQSNLEVLEKTIEKVCCNMGGQRVLDMYSGCGTFSVFLADIFKDVTLVEHNRDALVFAEQNMAGKQHTSYGMSGEKFVQSQARSLLDTYGQFDAVVIDPPRSGMEKAVCDWLCREKTYQIRAVSCDPATQARDVAKLVKAGYTLSRLYLLDFYPQTCHIESLACLENNA